MLDFSRFDNHLIENRQVRVFLSSTFSDMQEERTELVKAFEVLKVEAAKRNVSLSVVDLRWGVTKEEVKSGKVISVCLEEIEHSHPFFIGILGNKYGTAPKREELKKNPELLERYKWLDNAISDDEEKGMSITEMEIQYGVLKNENDIDAAFYFRNSDGLDNNERLTKLKGEIRDYCRSKGREDLPKEYSEVSELCAYVMEEVRNVINKHFPETKEVTLLDRERSAQKAYINSRHSSYYPRSSYYIILDNFVKSDEQYLVVTGESGIGKSALLANWIKLNENNPGFNLIYHFVGNSFSGNSYENILRHLCDEIYDLYSIEKREDLNETIDEEAQRLVADIYSKDKSLVVVIDGINQIITLGEGREKLLLWLPSANKNVKFIFSTLPDDETMAAFKRREYWITEVKPLSKKERRVWIPKYLKRVGKKIEEKRQDNKPSQLERIVNAPICKNTLVLKTLLDELTCFGIHEELDNRINYYLAAISISDFFDKVLQRMEKDYSEDIVRHALSLIAVSEHGLSEDELLDILGLKHRPLEWHLFFCAFYNHFVVKNGLITFSQQYIVDAIIDRYYDGYYCRQMPDEESFKQIAYREELKNYFLQLDTNRGKEESAFQLFKMSRWHELYLLLSQISTLVYFYHNCKSNLVRYWLYLKEQGYDTNVYKEQLSVLPDQEKITVLSILSLVSCNELENSELAGYCIQELLNQDGLNEFERSEVLITKGIFHHMSGDYELAIDNFKQAAEISTQNNEDELKAELYVLQTYYDMILACKNNNDIDIIIAKSDQLCVASALLHGSNSYMHATFLTQRGLFAHNIGKYTLALNDLMSAHAIYKNLTGEKSIDYFTSMNNIGLVYADMPGCLNKSFYYLGQAWETIFSLVGDVSNPHTAKVFGNLSYSYSKAGDHEEAFKYQKRALDNYLSLYGSCPNPLVAECYWNMSYEKECLGPKYYEQAYYYECKDYEIQCSLYGRNDARTQVSYKRLCRLKHLLNA